MRIKYILKSILGNIMCIHYKIMHHGKNIYIGLRTKCIGGKHIYLGDNVSIRPNNFINCSIKAILKIGNNTDIGTRSRISAIKNVIIGDNVLISPNVYISDCDHEYKQIGIPIMHQGVVKKDNKVVIEDNSYIGINAVIIGNVHIGKHCIVGANSVVTKDIPDYCVAVGTSAKVIKRYNAKTKKWEN